MVRHRSKQRRRSLSYSFLFQCRPSLRTRHLAHTLDEFLEPEKQVLGVEFPEQADE